MEIGGTAEQQPSPRSEQLLINSYSAPWDGVSVRPRPDLNLVLEYVKFKAHKNFQKSELFTLEKKPQILNLDASVDHPT